MIYLDHSATTPVDPEVREAMLPFLGEEFGNPSSSHALGMRARAAVDRAREQVAALLCCAPEEIVFTGGGSEADNLALKGIADMLGERGNHIITSVIEHPAIINPCRHLERKGFHISYLPVDSTGLVAAEAVRSAITDATILISIMHANNEVGTIQPVEEIGRIARERGIAFHTDAAQSVGKIPTRVADLGVDLLTVAGHKLYAPKGVGALFVRRGVALEPLVHGAAHEHGLRAGTENVAGIVGLGQACEIAGRDLVETARRVQELRDALHRGLQEKIGGVRLNGHAERRLPNTLNLSFEGLDSDALLRALPEIAASTGAACHAHSREPSVVLTAMGVPAELALGAVRFSLGRGNTAGEMERAAELIVAAVGNLRGRPAP
jgi:cysteine desulfurase